MGGKRVILVKTNLLDVDPRLLKEINTLKHENYIITLLCWDRKCKSDSLKNPDTHQEITLKFKAPMGIKVLFFLPLWWFFVLWKLIITDWDIVHSINLDTLIPSLIAAKLKRRSLVYEIFDVYADFIVLPRIIRRIGINVEKSLIRATDGVILANEGQPAELNGVPHHNVIKIFNSPPDTYRGSNNPPNTTFTIFFAGGLYNKRRTNVDKVYAAIKKIDRTKIIIAGFGDEVDEIRRWSITDPGKIEFLGMINYQEVLKRTLESDLIFALYDPVVPTTRFAGCNKLFEAMMAGKPILVCKDTVMAEIVNRESCGIVVESQDVQQIYNTIIKLKDDSELRQRIGANGRKAYEERYNWEIMKDRLLNFYQQIS